jgi:hypothetical protein
LACGAGGKADEKRHPPEEGASQDLLSFVTTVLRHVDL